MRQKVRPAILPAISCVTLNNSLPLSVLQSLQPFLWASSNDLGMAVEKSPQEGKEGVQTQG